MSKVGYVLGLAAVWVLLWGTPSPANVLGGLAVGLVLLVVLATPPTARRWPLVRPLALARLVGYVLISAVRSNVLLTRQILTPRRRIPAAVIGVPLPVCSDELVTLISNLLAVTPGTLPLELRDEPRQLFVHVLQLEPLEDARRGVYELTVRCIRAFGSPEAIARFDDEAPPA